MQPEWGSWGRPGREYFRAATGEHEHEWRDTGYATVEDCDCGAIRSGDFMKEPVANCPDHAVPLLDVRRVDAFITLLDWPSGVVVHACERELEITRE